MPQPGLQTPESPLVNGTTARPDATLLSGYVFGSGIHKPEHSNLLSYKYPQYTLTSFMERVGRYKGIGQSVWSWNEMDRTRKSTGVISGRGANGATTNITTNITYDAPNQGYFIVGDVLIANSGKKGRVTAIADNLGLQELTLETIDGVNFVAGDFANGQSAGHGYNLFDEYSEAPTGRLYLPEERFNKLGILRRSFSISGSEFTNKTYLGNGDSWYFQQEDIEMKEFARDREIYTMFGSMSAATGVKSGEGVWTSIASGGVVNTFGTANVQEQDIIDHITDLVISSPAKEYLVLCGAKFFADLTLELRDYYTSGGVNYGTFSDNGVKVGLGLQTYVFMGKICNFVHYPLFDDTQALANTVATVNNVNFTNASLWLDMGADETGEKLICMKYKELNGRQRKFIHGYETGMMSPVGAAGGHISNSRDGFKINYLSEIGVEVRSLNRHGVLWGTM